MSDRNLEDMSEQDHLEFEKQLEAKYPKMFVHKYGGLEIGPGWYQLIETLCARIQSHIDWKEKRGDSIEQVTIDQIKEKFGTLRFYYSGGDEYISGLATMAESISGYICETCGDRGSVGGRGWIKTACERHRRP